jgi:hypothetical protein
MKNVAEIAGENKKEVKRLKFNVKVNKKKMKQQTLTLKNAKNVEEERQNGMD